MSEQRYDLVVIGSGPAGYVAAIRAAQLGMKVACVEKDKTLGGTCLNVGCIPSKALLDSSEKFYQVKHKFSKHGIMVSDVKLDLELMMKRKEGVVRQLTGGIAGLFKKNKIEHVLGEGRFAGIDGNLKKVAVKAADGSEKIVTAEKVLIATGSVPAELPFIPFDGTKVISSTEALSLSAVPARLVIIGGGVIGVEMGSVWSRLGSKVTVVEFQDRLIPTMDRALSADLFKVLTKQGLEIKVATKCLGAKVGPKSVTLEIEDIASSKKSALEADIVLVSTGRKPYTGGLELSKVGLETDKQGRIAINDHFETSAKGIYAVGDVVRGAMLAHKAEEEGIAAVEIMAGQAGHVNYHAIPNVVYTWPEVASVGFTEDEANEKGLAFSIGNFPFLANGRAKAMDETDGFVKIIADTKTDRVLGVHIIGPNASELIAESATTIEYGGSAEDIARTCHAHPTLSETVKEAAMAVAKRQIHL